MMDICTKCGLVHAGQGVADLCVVAQGNAIRKLLNLVGTPGVCKGCQASVVWTTHNNGAKTPYDWSGLNHFVSCPKASDFKKAACR